MTNDLERELEQLQSIQSELDSSNAVLEQVWAALAARGSDPIPVTDAEPFEIEAACRVDSRRHAHAVPCGLRC